MRLRAFLAPAALTVAPGARAQEFPADTTPAAQLPLVQTYATPGESRGWFAPTTPAEAAEWIFRLAADLEEVSLDTLALIPGDPAVPDSALPVLLVRVRARGPAGPARDAPAGARGKDLVRVLVLSGERGDEPAGLETSLRTIRDVSSGPLRRFLEELELAVVPAVNPWGQLWWIPGEPSGLDPSRDHAALRSAASRAVHGFVARWQPHLVVDLRELGPTVYRVQIGLPVHPNADARLARFGRFYLLPYVASELTRASVTFREHVAVEPALAVREPLVRGADALPEEAFLSPGHLGAAEASNAFALGGSLSLMLGVASLEGVDGLDRRVELQYRALEALLEVAAGRGDGLRERVEQARDLPGGPAGDPGETTTLALRWRWEPDPDRPALTWLTWSDRGTIMRQTTGRWRSALRRLLVVRVPAGWVIEPDGGEWADLVRAHGFRVERLTRNVRATAGAYAVGVPERLPAGLADGLPPDSAPDASGLILREERRFAAGSWVVRADQPRARLLFTLLEPWSEDAPLAGVRSGGTTPGRAAGSFLYPIYRVDAGALARLPTEPAAEVGIIGRGFD